MSDGRIYFGDDKYVLIDEGTKKIWIIQKYKGSGHLTHVVQLFNLDETLSLIEVLKQNVHILSV